MVAYYGNNDWRDYHLAHHGIDGMHWGQRNGPPYPLHSEQLSSAERRAEKYRSKELSIINAKNLKRYNRTQKQLNKISKKTIEAREQGNKKRIDKITKKAVSLAKENIIGDYIYEKERQAIMNMSVDDIKAEKRAYGRKIVSNILAGGVIMGGAKVAATAAGMPFAMIMIPITDRSAYLRKKRIGKNTEKEFTKKVQNMSLTEAIQRYEDAEQAVKRGE